MLGFAEPNPTYELSFSDKSIKDFSKNMRASDNLHEQETVSLVFGSVSVFSEDLGVKCNPCWISNESPIIDSFIGKQGFLPADWITIFDVKEYNEALIVNDLMLHHHSLRRIKVFGRPANKDELEESAREYGLKVEFIWLI